MKHANGFHFYQNIWRPAELVISQMERNGVRLDTGACHRNAAEITPEIEQLTAELNLWAGQDIAWTSPKQLALFLYSTLPTPAVADGPVITPKGFDVPPVKGTLLAVKVNNGDWSTSEAAVQYVADHAECATDRQMLRQLLELQKKIKVRQFLRLLPRYPVDGRIHCQLGPNTETGRLNSKNPNLQNIPVRSVDGKRVRECFIPADGYELVCLDFAGLEWRILAHCLGKMYGDMSLVNDIVNGIDPHSATAVRMYPECAATPVELVKEHHPKLRNDAKTLNYSVVYDKSAVGLGVQLRDDAGEPIGTDAGQALLDAFFRGNPGIKRFQDDMVEYARNHGYVRSLLGRRRYLDVVSEPRWIRTKQERRAKNSPIQMSAADVVTMAMLRCNTYDDPGLCTRGAFSLTLEKLGARLLLQVHDELLFEAPIQHAQEVREVAAEQMARCLEGVRDFLCPLEVDGATGDNWRIAGGK